MNNPAVTIICVVNNREIFNATIATNRHMVQNSIRDYDNTAKNVPITERYNHFIRHHMKSWEWLIFCHQDFGFLEDPYPKLQALDKNCIYGPIGAARKKGIYFRNHVIRFERKELFGQINQARNDDKFFKNGIYLQKPRLVDTVDCCCMIVHSSLIKKYDLHFDERLTYHLYAEEFSLHARYSYGIKTKAIQIECKHLSFGNTTRNFYDSLAYLKSKYKGKQFVGTCF